MKYIFKPIEEKYKWQMDWFENTLATPPRLDLGAGFALKDLRRWFLQWVLK